MHFKKNPRLCCLAVIVKIRQLNLENRSPNLLQAFARVRREGGGKEKDFSPPFGCANAEPPILDVNPLDINR